MLKDSSSIKLSIIVTTYNHAPYIEKCINSIIAQETDYSYEILIGEDESNDGTREICQKLALKYPDKIKLFLRSRKDVIYVEGNAVGKYNFIQTLLQAEGGYIAICDGDDYWQDTLKIQNQINILENNDNIGLVYTNYRVVNDQNDVTIEKKYKTNMPSGNIIEEIIKGQFPWTVTTCFRKKLIEPIDSVFKTNYLMADFPIWLHIGIQSEIYYLNEISCTYRKHQTSVTGLNISYLKKAKFNISWVQILLDFIAKNNISDNSLLNKIKPLIQIRLLTAFSMSLQANETQLAKSIWKDLKKNACPIPFKHQLLHKSMYFGVLGKWLINFYYKK